MGKRRAGEADNRRDRGKQQKTGKRRGGKRRKRKRGSIRAKEGGKDGVVKEGAGSEKREIARNSFQA